MTIISQLKERRAVRDHEAREVEQEKIEQLLEAATWAPNDRMREPWSFYVIQGEAKKKYEELAEAYLKERFPTKPHLVESSLKAVKNTPVHIVVMLTQLKETTKPLKTTNMRFHARFIPCG
ncbi:nitroreductase family protein [Priestia megaterium]|nr:nitroreductase family protein [Priestia megaterium]SUX76849.1 nitroreductase family protein [Priestia megaterium]